MKIFPPGCEGCRSFLNYYMECGFTKWGEKMIPKCPCSICLIKIMCTSSCKPFDIHIENLKNSNSKVL
jgi:hypothetical protein